MQKLSEICLLFLFIVCAALSATAQRASNDWRVTKKERTVNTGQKFMYDYTYSSDGRIESVKYYSATGILTSTITDFKFDRNGKPSFYTVTYNRENAKAQVNLAYDNNRRLTRLEKVLDQNDKTIFTYRYTGNTIIVTEELPRSQKGANNNLSYYTDNGDYTETTGDEASHTIKSVITIKANPVASPENEPDKFYGGYEAPGFLGISANGSDPEIAITKNEQGQIAERIITKRGGVEKTEYTYTKINSRATSNDNPVTTIQTNINCEEGKKIIEQRLKSMDGVKTVAVDIRTGKLKIDYSSDGTSYTEIINLINDLGFDADRNKSQVPNANPCKPNTANTFSIANLKKIYQLREVSASLELKQQLMEQRSMIARNNFKYEVANTEVSEYLIKDITGFKRISRSEILRLRDIDKTKPFNPGVASFLKNYKPTADASLSQFDARDYIKMPEIRTQKCGSCWVYAAVGLLEISYMAQKGYATKNTIDLSEKQVLGCSTAGTCDGGWHFIAMEWMKNTNQKLLPEESLKDDRSLPKKSSLPDAEFVNVPCNVADVKKYFVQIADWGIVQKDKDLDKVADEYDIKDAVVKYGAVAVSIYASPVFHNYASGETFEENEMAYKDSSINHVVIIIGWDNKKQAWLIRNSWGKGWGDGGYGWIKYTTNHIGKYAIWCVAKFAPPPSIRLPRSESIPPVTLKGELLPGIQFPGGSTLVSSNGLYEFKNSNNSIVYIAKHPDGTLAASLHIDPFKDYSSVYKFYSEIPKTGSNTASPFYLEDNEGNLFTPFGTKPFKKLLLTDGGNLIAYGTDDSILWSLKPVPPKIRRK